MAVIEWAWLPKNVLDSILEKIESIYDYVRFAVVCKPWLSVARDQHHQKKRLESKSCHRQLPLLLIPTSYGRGDLEEEESQMHHYRALHTVIGWRTLETKLCVPFNRRCCGSSHGWLIFADEQKMTLYNPFTTATILLPPIKVNDNFLQKEYEVQKVVLSKDPSLAPHDYEVVAIYEYENIAFYKSGNDSWVYPTKVHFGIPMLMFNDILYYGGRFYVVSQKLLACLQVDEPKSTTSRVVLKEVKRRTSQKDIACYMVESCRGGHLLYIERYHVENAVYHDDERVCAAGNGYFKIDGTHHRYKPDLNRLARYFLVYKVKNINNNEGQVEYIEVNNLGDDEALFIGHNDAVSVLASNFPGCERNTIYYTDEYWSSYKGPYKPHGPIDMGFFSLNDSEVPEAKRRYMLEYPFVSKDLPPPIWIVPKANL